MRLGLGLLRWPPDTFWRASLRELNAAFAAPRDEAMSAGELGALMRAFPDKEK